MEGKKKLRKNLLKNREVMEKQTVEKLSKKIMKNVIKIPEFKQSKVVMIYLSFKNEVETNELIDWCFEQGKEVVIPYCVVDNRQIIPCKLDVERKGLKKNKYGIWEPKKDSMVTVEIENIDSIIIPGVGFDENCNRLGFGGGYYDRFLVKRKKNIPAIAICYQNQIIKSVPTDNYDIPMDMVVTECNIFHRKK
ncbi:5-formyltetrahydrofolate cyclo-ligase [Wukongibacter baidiensis]|uniref:5-formyltetrahydrofolate cyclo-ligase n=1 Tax=Wukongibacter baidiensis TaxID=1723361 RepID=UPI003D7F4EAA